MRHEKLLAMVLIILFIGSFQACSKSSSSSDSGAATPSGTLSVLVTDAPGDFDNAYITVKDIWFHTSDSAGPQEAGWIKRPLDSPVTVDLLTLANGGMQALWSGVTLSTGDYQQIRLILADSDDPLTDSANAAGLKFNDEVKINGTEYELDIPDASHGILLNGHFRMAAGGALRLAIDFDAGHDIVELRHGDEYILKPRLRYYDLDNVGAIIGKLSTNGSFTALPRFVIKAEGLNDDNTYHVVTRSTVPRADGSFVLYPVSAATASTCDVLIRGVNYETVVIKGVPVTRGALPTAGATDLGTISMAAATTPDFLSSASITSPTGAWVNFYQTLPGEKPYEIRFRHFFPLTGNFTDYPLSSDPIRVGTYGATMSFATITPLEGAGTYQAVADAVLYDRSAWNVLVSAASPTVALGPLAVSSPWTSDKIAGSITMNNPMKMNSKMNSGVLFAVHGGMIVNAIDVGSLMQAGGTYEMPNVPGGSTANRHPLAVYGVQAMGWDSAHPRMNRAVASPVIADLRAGDDTNADMNMLPLW